MFLAQQRSVLYEEGSIACPSLEGKYQKNRTLRKHNVCFHNRKRSSHQFLHKVQSAGRGQDKGPGHSDTNQRRASAINARAETVQWADIGGPLAAGDPANLPEPHEEFSQVASSEWLQQGGLGAGSRTGRPWGPGWAGAAALLAPPSSATIFSAGRTLRFRRFVSPAAGRHRPPGASLGPQVPAAPALAAPCRTTTPGMPRVGVPHKAPRTAPRGLRAGDRASRAARWKRLAARGGGEGATTCSWRVLRALGVSRPRLFHGERRGRSAHLPPREHGPVGGVARPRGQSWGAARGPAPSCVRNPGGQRRSIRTRGTSAQRRVSGGRARGHRDPALFPGSLPPDRGPGSDPGRWDPSARWSPVAGGGGLIARPGTRVLGNSSVSPKGWRVFPESGEVAPETRVGVCHGSLVSKSESSCLGRGSPSSPAFTQRRVLF